MNGAVVEQQPLQEWLREAQLFLFLRKLRFYRHPSTWNALVVWRRRMRQRRFHVARRVVQRHLLQLRTKALHRGAAAAAEPSMALPTAIPSQAAASVASCLAAVRLLCYGIESLPLWRWPWDWQGGRGSGGSGGESSGGGGGTAPSAPLAQQPGETSSVAAVVMSVPSAADLWLGRGEKDSSGGTGSDAVFSLATADIDVGEAPQRPSQPGGSAGDDSGGLDALRNVAAWRVEEMSAIQAQYRTAVQALLRNVGIQCQQLLSVVCERELRIDMAAEEEAALLQRKPRKEKLVKEFRLKPHSLAARSRTTLEMLRGLIQVVEVRLAAVPPFPPNFSLCHSLTPVFLSSPPSSSPAAAAVVVVHQLLCV